MAQEKERIRSRAASRNLPDELGSDRNSKTVLERLIQPQRRTKRLFDVLMAGLGREIKIAKLAKLAMALYRGYWAYALLGAAVLLLPLLLVALAFAIGGWPPFFLIAVSFIPAAILALLAAAIGACAVIFYRLPANGYGFCSGSSNGVPDEAGVLPLTDWLHQLFQEIAGKEPGNDPVIFGELWNQDRDENAERDIDLVLMTTNVTRGISQRFPFLEGSWGQLFFRKEDFYLLFPASVVDWLWEHADAPRHADKVEVPSDFRPLPKAANLPIILGARMSFPFLLSAVPLYAANVAAKRDGQKIPLEKCWFSDGGLTSNFPIHFFDAPLPSRPTFGINLVPESVGVGDLSEEGHGQRITGFKPGGDPIEQPVDARWKNIYMPSTNASGIGSTARFNLFTSIGGFFSALFDTARNWGDTELMAMPGYHDRIVHVALSEDEGGLNLNMGRDVIMRIAERGERAGELLAARFAFDLKPDPQSNHEIRLTWDNHRWARFRSFTAALEDVLRRLRATWLDAKEHKPWRSYQELLDREPGTKPKSFAFGTKGQRSFAIDATDDLVNIVAEWTTSDNTFDRGEVTDRGRSPRPKPVLRMMPPGSNDPRLERAGTQSAEPPAAE